MTVSVTAYSDEMKLNDTKPLQVGNQAQKKTVSLAKTVSLTMEEVLSRAREKDLELQGLSFSLNELVRSKKNVYRSLFPTITTSLGTSRILSTGETDVRSYDFSLTLDQVLYNQLSIPLALQNFDISVEEAGINMKQREKTLKQQAVRFYLALLLADERLKNKKKEYELYKTFLQLVREEYKVGMRTMLDVVDTENDMLEAQLEMESLAAQNEILRRDLLNFIGVDRDTDVVLEDDLADIFSSLFVGVDKKKKSFDFVYGYMLSRMNLLFDDEKMYMTALNNNFEIKKLRLDQRQKLMQQRLMSIQFLENISVRYEIDFTGGKFFPANTGHTVSLNVLFDFGVLSSDVSVADSSSKSVKSTSKTADTEVLGDFDLMDKKRMLRFQLYTAGEKIEQNKKMIQKQVDTWVIQMKSLMKAYAIKLNQKKLYAKNDELFRIQLELGSAKQVDYLDFLIRKNEFLIELEELRYGFIDQLWLLEDILNIELKDVL